MSEQERGNNIVVKILIAAVLMVTLAASPVSAQDRPQVNTSGMDALGEFLRGMKTLADVKKVLPGGDSFLERVRTKYEIPERIDIFAPRGGGEVIVLAFDGERLPVVEGKWNEITPGEYKYLQSHHNLKAVYCLHEKEPLDLGDVVIAVRPEEAGMLSVYFNDKKGSVGSARIRRGNAMLFSGSRYIVRPLIEELQR